LKLALAPHAWFDPVLEWYTPRSDFSHGTYFGLGRLGDAGNRCGSLSQYRAASTGSLLAFIHETTERFLPSAPSEIQGNSSMIPRQRIHRREPMEEKRPLRRQPEDHHFWSLIMLAVTAAAFLLVVWLATKALFVFSTRVSDSLKIDWQRHVLTVSGYLELGMFDDAALILEKIAPEDNSRNQVVDAATQIVIMSLAIVVSRRYRARFTLPNIRRSLR
jgi:hypothetical protein